MDTDSIYLILISILSSAFFSGMELAYISSNRLKIELQKQSEGISAALIRILDNHRSRVIAMLLLGNNISLVIYGIAMSKILDFYFLQWYLSTNTLLLLKTIISTLIVLITAEFLPKVIVQLNPNRFLNLGIFPLYGFYIILYIPTQLIVWISNLILLVFKSQEAPRTDVFSKVDLEHFVSNYTENSSNESSNSELLLLKNALEFTKIKARDCMIPRTEIKAVEINSSLDDAMALFVETGLSKIIVFREDIDNIIGYVHCYDFFNKPEKLSRILKPIGFVPNSISGKELLATFNNQAGNVSVVTDEYGGTAGIVTLEDVIEEIFGEIVDEYDRDHLIELQLSDNEFLFSARMEIDQLNDTYNFNFPKSDDYDTLAGFILEKLEYIPKKGEVLEWENCRIIVESVTDRKIEKIRIIKDK